MAKIAFIQHEMREQFSFMLMSAKLKEAGHEVKVFIFNGGEKEHVIEMLTLVQFRPDIIGFSSTTISFNNDIKLLEYIKGMTKLKESFIIFGGPQPTYNPEETIKHDCIDAICIGEGIDAIVELANDIDRKDIQNLWIKESYCYGQFCGYGIKIHKNPIRPISNINDWSRPDYDLYYKKYPILANKATKPVYIVRGCPYKCAFCYNPAYNKMYKNVCETIWNDAKSATVIKNKIFQCMDVDKAIEEIRWLKDNYDFKYLQFISDNMTINKKWLKKFMTAYRERILEDGMWFAWGTLTGDNIKTGIKFPIPFLMNCRANEVTKEIVDILKESGCNRVDFGVEHGNDYIRNDILKRNMSKQQIIQCGQWFKEAGIRVQTTNIFGLPHETFKKSWESVELNRQFTPEISKACILQPFENTAVYNYAKKNNLLKDDMQYSGTTLQIGVDDNRSNESKIKIKNEKQIIRLSYLFDFFVKCRIPRWLGFIICSLPLDRLYKKYYAYLFRKQNEKYR